MTEYIRYVQQPDTPFKFRARLSGQDYFCTVFFNFYARRLYLRIDDSSGRLRSFKPMVSSGQNGDINLALNLSPGSIVYRGSVQQFEVSG